MQKEGPIVTFSHLVKKIRAEGFTWKKIPVQAVSEKKSSCKLKISPLPHHFSNGPSLIDHNRESVAHKTLTTQCIRALSRTLDTSLYTAQNPSWFCQLIFASVTNRFHPIMAQYLPTEGQTVILLFVVLHSPSFLDIDIHFVQTFRLGEGFFSLFGVWRKSFLYNYNLLLIFRLNSLGKKKKNKYYCNLDDEPFFFKQNDTMEKCFFFSTVNLQTPKKQIRVLPIGVEPTTFRLLVRILHTARIYTSWTNILACTWHLIPPIKQL